MKEIVISLKGKGQSGQGIVDDKRHGFKLVCDHDENFLILMDLFLL